MTQKLRFGVLTLQDGTWPEMVNRWKQIESLGMDSIWVADHFVNYMQPEGPWFESWTLLAGLATQTERIRIGTLVTAIPWRNPAILARQALTVDHISNGRLELGLGAGAPGSVDCSYTMTGTEDWPPGERVTRFGEAVEIVDQLLRNPMSSYEGEYYHVEQAAMNPPPIQKPRPPITIGALSPRMLKLAARYADTWNSYGGNMQTSDEMLASTSECIQRLDAYCAEIGRDPNNLRRSLLVFGPEGEVMYTSADGFEDVFRRYRDIGITEFIIYYPFMPEMLPFYERIINDVIPRIREENG